MAHALSRAGKIVSSLHRRERIVLICMVIILSVIYVIAFCRHEQWKRQYTIVIEELQSHVSINHAGQRELESLPGIGPALAQQIIEYREHHGYFTTLEGLKKVKGIGDKKLQKLKPFIKL